MKKSFSILMSIMLILVGCSSDKQSNISEENTMNPLADGAFLLSKVTITEDGEKTELLRDQMKIYSNGKFMFAFDNESTGDMDVGAGNASWVNGVLVEEPLYNHDGPLSDLSFDITIEPTENGFNQVLHGMEYDDGRVLETMVEEWNRAPGVVTPYDGLWKLEGRETDDPELTEFSEIKMIGGGHFIILQSAMYQGEKVRNFGFGSLILTGASKVLETGMVGSWENYSDWATEVTMKMVDDNHLTQSFNFNGRSGHSELRSNLSNIGPRTAGPFCI
jgi:hypothetical protein